METFGNTKISQDFYCNFCYYKTCKKNDYIKHLKTTKHFGNQMETKKSHCIFKCENCEKEYKNRSGLWKHSKKCLFNNDFIYMDDNCNPDITEPHVIMQLLKQNDDFKQLIADQNKTIVEQSNKLFEICKYNTCNTNINNVNSNNKTFNLNLFLNETCKDAMNITDFIDSLKIQLSDLENVGEVGFIEGISNIIIKNLKALDIHKRPVHCSDSKREVMYIKDEDKWEKENENKNKLRKVIKKVANKNSRLLPEFKAKHPDCIKSISPFSDQYNKLIIESMGGSGDNDYEKENKIIKKIAKEVIIDKDIIYT
jgi:hypothetical protein